MKITVNKLTWLIIHFIFLSCSTSNETSIQIPYPQPLPDTSPLVFLPNFVSQDGLDFNSTFSPDGKAFYFARSKNGQWDIYVTRHYGSKWSEPALAQFSDPKYSEADPAFSPDGRLCFISNRPKHPEDSLSDFDIWFIKPVGNGQWSEPENFREINSDSAEYYISFSKNGNAYFGSARKGGFGGEDIYMSRFINGAYTEPENLGSTINTKESEHDACIWPNEDFIVFKSENQNDGFGEADLYGAKYKTNNQWTQPINLGSKVNTKTYEYCPYLTPDHRYFFYSSEFDIKWVKANVIENYIDSLTKE